MLPEQSENADRLPFGVFGCGFVRRHCAHFRFRSIRTALQGAPTSAPEVTPPRDWRWRAKPSAGEGAENRFRTGATSVRLEQAGFYGLIFHREPDGGPLGCREYSKLFLWPQVLWPQAEQRLQTSFLSCHGFAMVAIWVWLYPDLLHDIHDIVSFLGGIGG